MNKDLLIEKIREANSPDSAYQHMLDTIADAVEEAFHDGDGMRGEIGDFIRGWRP